MVTDEVAESLSALSDEIDVIWASSWEERSLELAEELDISSVGFLDFSRALYGTWFKTEAVREFLSNNVRRRVICAEDEADEDTMKKWTEAHEGLLMLDIDGDTGLTAEHFAQIRAHIA